MASHRSRSGIFIWFVCLLITLPAAAHIPEGVVYKIYQFDDANVPQMDGELSDWDQVPAEYVFDYRHHAEAKEGLGDKHNTADFFIKRVAVGWNDRLNRLYFMVEVYDNVHLFSKPPEEIAALDTYESRRTGAYVHGSDIFEIVIDADHGGERVVNLSSNEAEERRLRSAYTQNYHLYIPPLNGDYWHWMWGYAMWTDDPNYSAVGWQYPGEHGSSGTVTYECYLTPFDDLHPDGPESSTVHDLTEVAIIGLSWAFLDADTGSPKQRRFWSLTGSREMAQRGDALADFELMPLDTSGRDPAAYPPGTFVMTPVVDAELEAVPLVVPDEFANQLPEGLTMNVPPGFSVQVFAAGLEGPRLMDFSPEGVLHVANMKAGGGSNFKPPAGSNSSQIVALPDWDYDGAADEVIVAVDGLSWANDLAFDRQGNMFVTDANQLLRLRDGDGDGRYEDRVVLADLPSWIEQPSDVQHITHSLVLDEQNQKIYVSVGSTCDICREAEAERAVILEFNLDGTGRRIFASGIRNAIGLDLHPLTNQLWATNNGHDREGILLSPEWIDIIRDGGFYGWPLAYPHQVYVDLSIDQYNTALSPLTPEDQQKVAQMQRPIALLPAHLAPMAIYFYTGQAFPPLYHNAAFFALRAGKGGPMPGYKVMALFSQPDGSQAQVADFLTGFEPDPFDRGNVWGYPVGITSDAQGNLYVSSDWGAHVILKVIPAQIKAFLEETLPDTAIAGKALELNAIVRVQGHEQGQTPVMTAHLSDLGGPDSLPLVALGNNRYSLTTTLMPPQAGEKTIIVRIEQQIPYNRLATEIRHQILVTSPTLGGRR